jgi:pSer/pThr/pTyr-binding forkhead associated (FHA) protein
MDTRSVLDTLGKEFEEWKAKVRRKDWLEATAEEWQVSLETLRWLALIPSWTVKLAAFCRITEADPTPENVTEATPFEEQNRDLIGQMDQMLERLNKQGLLNAQVSPVILPSGLDDGRQHRRMVYQMDDWEREEVLRNMREREGQSGIVQHLVNYASRILQARNTVELPKDLLIWAQLAQRVDAPAQLVGMVEQLVEQATVITPTASEESTTRRKIFAISNLPPSAGHPTPPYFNCVQYNSLGEVVREWYAPITQLPFSIGRTMRNALILNDSRVSRNHAFVERREDGYYITDTKSSNGIFDHNGKRLEAGKAYRLEEGQTLKFGDPAIFELTFHLPTTPADADNIPLLPASPTLQPASSQPRELNQATAPFGTQDRTTQPNRLGPVQGWINPLQVEADNSQETVHLPTLEGHLNRALQWVETARKLQEHLDPASHVRLDRASARLQLQFRRWDDLQQLKTFLERPEQIAAFETLLNAPDDEWALHYLGPGGYGKTTLIRYLVTRLAPERGLPVARIDFDHLDPHYPRYQPGLLLSALAEELRLQAGQAYTFSGFDQSIASFYEKYPATETGPGRGESRDWLGDPIFKKVLDDFAAALKEMGGKVLLVLDTCEELTKVRLAGQPAENVSLTLDLLNRLHELEPRLRVIFCGRRPLASSGNGWQYVRRGGRNRGDKAETEQDVPALQLFPRPYLALFPVTGFSREEGETYLKAAGVSQEFWSAIIDKTMAPAPEIFENFEWNETSPIKPASVRRLRGRKGLRSNPFDLALYANWVREEPEVTPKMIQETDLQRYVETRIVGRARSELSDEILTAITLLGKFDYALLKATLGVEGESDRSERSFGAYDSFDGAYQAVGAYEWINHSNNGWLEIQPPLLERLREFYHQQVENSEEVRRLWTRLRTQALAHLEERTLTDARNQGGFETAEVTLQLYADQDPADAFEWFSRFNRTVLNWNWAQTATERLLAVGLKKSPVTQLLQARILVLQGAARLHLYAAADLRELWRRTTEYIDQADHEAASAGAGSYEQSNAFTLRLKFVRLLALTGEAAACFRFGEALPEARWNEFWKVAGEINPQAFPRETGAILGAIEAAVEARENDQLSRSLPVDIIEQVYKVLNRDWKWENSTAQPRLLAAFARSLLGRALFYEGQISDGLQHLEQAEEAGRKISTAAHLDADWVYLWAAPEDFSARLQIEWGRLARSRLPLRLAETHLPLPKTLQNPANLDQDRLIGLQLAFSEDLRPSPDRRLSELTSLMIEPAGYSLFAEVNAHRSLLPARVAAAKALSGVGHFGEAIAQLDSFIKSAEERSDSPASLPETQVLVELATAARLGPDVVRRFNELLNSTDPESLRLVWGLEGLEGRRRPPVTPWKNPVCLPLHAHYRWRGGYGLRKEYALALSEVYREMADRARQQSAPRSPVARLRHEFELYQLKLDDLERQLLLAEYNQQPKDSKQLDPGPPQFGDKLDDLGLRLNHLLLAQARYQALTFKQAGDEIRIASNLLDRLGTRYAARLLLQDGELLALRLPQKAVYLLSAARSLFQGSREPDSLSAAYAAICETQALIRAERPDRARVIWHEVENHYEKFRANWPGLSEMLGLPEWNILEQAYNHPDNKKLILEELYNNLNPNWRPWLIRILFTGVALKGEVDEWLTMRRTLNPVLQASAEKENGLNLLPAELDGLVDETEYTTDRKLITPRPWTAPFSSKKELPKLEIALEEAPTTQPLRTNDPILVRLRDLSGVGASSLTTTVTARPWNLIRHIEGDPSQKQISERRLPGSWRSAFEQRLSRYSAKRSRPIPVVFQVQEGLSFLPWESLTARNVALALQPEVALRRVTKTWNQQRPLETSAPRLLLVSDPSLDELRKLYEPLKEKFLSEGVQRLDLESVANPESVTRQSRPPRLVHLITSARMIGETPRLLLSRRRSSYIGDTSNNGNSMPGLPGRDLAALFPAARLVIIQAQPVESAEWSVDAGYQAAYLRVIAEDIFKAGVPAVLTVPPLTLPDTRRFITSLVSYLGEIDWKRDAENGLIEAVSEARRALARQREETVRPALDICLYADSGPRLILNNG